jgi:hypothetical protein
VQLDCDLHFPADVKTVGAMLTNPAFVQFTAGRTHAGKVEAADVVETGDKGVVVSTRRAIPAAQVLAKVAPLVGRNIEIREVEAWEPEKLGRRRGSAAFEIAGVPMQCIGTLELTPVIGGSGAEADESRIRFVGTVTAQVPLVAAALEHALATRVQGLFRETEQAAAAWLGTGG